MDFVTTKIKTKGHYVTYLTFTLLLISSLSLNAQQDKSNYVEITGVVEDYEYKPIAGATVRLLESNQQVKSITTKVDGEFQFFVDYNKYYIVEISKPGMVTKKIAYDTKLPEGSKGIWGVGFPISLFEGCEGVVTSVMDEPIGLIKYNEKKRELEGDEDYRKQMQSKIGQLMSDIEICKQKKYNETIKEADSEYKQREYAKAKEIYEEALSLNPGDPYATKKLEEINQIMAKEDQTKKLYDVNITEGDKYFNADNLPLAKSFYQRALTFDPNAEYAKNKIAEIDRLLAQKEADNAQQTKQTEQKTKEEAYSKLIAEADKLFNIQDFNGAMNLYNQAQALQPNNPYPRMKVDEINSNKKKREEEEANQRAIDYAYKNAILDGDNNFQIKKYAEAKSAYQKALTYKPEADYPKTKIAEIDQLLAQQRQQKAQDDAKEQSYRNAVAEADQYMQAQNYQAAKNAYQKALAIKPDETYPRTRIAEADKQISESQRQMAQEQAKEQSYRNAIAEGDQYMQAKNYPAAKAAYQKALTFKPNDSYPNSKISEIDRIVAQQQQQLAQEQGFKNAVAEGDQYMQAKNYPAAKAAYQKALTFKPNDSYSNSKISEIDRILAQQQQQLAQEQAKEQGYKNAIAEGDQYMQSKNYLTAKAAYQKALTFRPNDSYPNSKISEIDRIVAQQQQQLAQEQGYKNAIAEGDQYLTAQNYPAAKAAYQKALTFKPNDSYPNSKIAEIDRIVADQQRLAVQAAEKDKQYNAAVAEGDKYMQSRNYSGAKTSYQKALTIKPGAAYPTDKIKEIDNLLTQQQIEKDYQNAITLADNHYKQNNLEEAKKEYEIASRLKPAENYPKTKIQEITNLLAQASKTEQEEKLKKVEFNRLISLADTYFNKKEFKNAKDTYNKSLAIFPGAPHPSARIKEIDKLLAQQTSAPPTVKKGPELAVLNFKTKDEETKYLEELKKNYPEGVTLEIYKSPRQTTRRFIVIRSGIANEYRQVQFSWGSEYSLNGRDITNQYFEQQTEVREGEYFKLFEIEN